MLSSHYADACAGRGVVRLFQPPDVPGAFGGSRLHAWDVGRTGASPEEPFFRGGDIGRGCCQPGPDRRRESSGRPAIRGRGRNASGEEGPRRQAEEQRGKKFPRGQLLSSRQRTGRKGHGSSDFPRRKVALHRRAPHGRTFACGARTSRHHESNLRNQPVNNRPSRTRPSRTNRGRSEKL